MKKHLASLFVLLFTLPALAQIPVTFGPMAGLNLSLNKIKEGSYDAQAQGGFLAGAFVRVNIKNFYIQPEVYYANSVSTVKSTAGSLDVKQKIKAGSVDVNALVGMKLVNLKIINVRALLGPQFSFNASKSVDNFNHSTLKNPDLSGSYVSGLFGVGVDIANITVDLRYRLGFGDYGTVDFSRVSSTLGSTKINNNAFLATIGFKIL
jgi:hypothetical protein